MRFKFGRAICQCKYCFDVSFSRLKYLNMVSNVEADESSNSSERKDSKKAKKTGPQYDCNITCLDGKVINTPVEVCFFCFYISTDLRLLF